MSRRLDGLNVVVTGAARGLGRAVADVLEQEGALVLRCDRAEADLRDRGAVRQLVDRLLSRFSKIHVLVNNAAVLPLTPIGEIHDTEWDETLAVNLTAPFLLIRGLLDALLRGEGGSVVNVSSRAGLHGFSNQVSYCASKFGIEGLTRALAVELANEPLSINTVTPGLRIKPTMMTEEEESRTPPERKYWEDAKRLGPAFVFLALARGRPTGMRFDALQLTRAIEHEGFSLDDYLLGEIAE